MSTRNILSAMTTKIAEVEIGQRAHMTGLDLFAGCGGASLGLARAGVHMVGHYERDCL